ncbi:hypothetical protein PCLA_12f0183 [Pseudomonas citronellolis]|nr:hypothetical protein PCLA_12f0183 [Pseudomonas citronellolis]
MKRTRQATLARPPRRREPAFRRRGIAGNKKPADGGFFIGALVL